MKRLLRTLVTIAVLAPLASACDGSAPPTAPGTTALASGTANAADVSTGTGTFTHSAVGYFSCAGEDVLSVVNAPYIYRTVQTPQGTFLYVERWLTDQVTGTLTGQTTGTVWTREGNVTVYVERHGSGDLARYAFRGYFTNEAGDRILVNELFHVSQNVNGELTVDKYEFNCRLR